jgi:hypothetical protein
LAAAAAPSATGGATTAHTESSNVADSQDGLPFEDDEVSAAAPAL